MRNALLTDRITEGHSREGLTEQTSTRAASFIPFYFVMQLLLEYCIGTFHVLTDCYTNCIFTCGDEPSGLWVEIINTFFWKFIILSSSFKVQREPNADVNFGKMTTY